VPRRLRAKPSFSRRLLSLFPCATAVSAVTTTGAVVARHLCLRWADQDRVVALPRLWTTLAIPMAVPDAGAAGQAVPPSTASAASSSAHAAPNSAFAAPAVPPVPATVLSTVAVPTPPTAAVASPAVMAAAEDGASMPPAPVRPSNKKKGKDQAAPESGPVVILSDERLTGVRAGLLAQRDRQLGSDGETLSVMCIGESTLRGWVEGGAGKVLVHQWSGRWIVVGGRATGWTIIRSIPPPPGAGSRYR